jgi:hypothetical protein
LGEKPTITIRANGVELDMIADCIDGLRCIMKELSEVDGDDLLPSGNPDDFIRGRIGSFLTRANLNTFRKY